jgi:ABC-type Zn uptake system ZnuABC Zn-binding protein ZnuA
MTATTQSTPRHRTGTHRRGFRLAALTGALALVLAACGGADDATETSEPTAPQPDAAVVAPIEVVATTSILGDLIANLLGDDGTVRVLMGPGVDPHGYEASAADAAAMRDAELVVANGLLLEEGLISTLEAAEADGVRVLSIADKLDPIPFGAGSHGDHDGDHDDHGDHGDDKHDDDKHDDHDDHGHDDDKHEDDDHDDHDDHEHGDEDPHFWWDPMRTMTAVELIAAELTDLRPEIDWAARAAAYNAQILEVHEELLALFATIPTERRSIITNHDALGYLAVAYDFEVIGTVIPGASTLAATNPQAFARLIDLVVAEGIDVIFAENTDSTVLAEQLASEAVGRGDVTLQVVRLYTDSLDGTGSGAETYLGMLRTTATLITEALASA